MKNSNFKKNNRRRRATSFFKQSALTYSIGISMSALAYSTWMISNPKREKKFQKIF